MSEGNQYQLKDTLKMLMNSYSKNPHSAQARIAHAYEKVVGKTVAKYTGKVYLKDRELFLYIETSPLKNELEYSKKKIVENLNKELGEDIIDTLTIKKF
ncbi:MAG: DUF721 domain-containing protein [Chitinophagaceae bacterium]|nr:MAG: DUF721 domain-containing protein [Chitinophagaceae bacterium]